MAIEETIARSVPVVISSIVAFLFAQAIFGVIWLVRQEGRITLTEIETKRQMAQIEFLLRRIDGIENRFGEVNIVNIREFSRLSGQIDLNNASLKRIDDQQIRIIQALDQTYNLLNEHLRIDHSGRQYPPPQNPPLKLPQAQ